MDKQILAEILDQSEIIINKAGLIRKKKGEKVTIFIPDYDFFMTLSGHFTLIIDNKEYNASAGDAFLITPNSTLTVITHEDSAHYLLHFSIIYFQKINLIGHFKEHRFTTNQSSLIKLFHEYISNSLGIPLDVTLPHKGIANPLKGITIPLKSICKIILTEMLLSHDENLREFISDNQHTSSDNILKIIKYIHDHPGIHLKSSQLAELSGFNKSYFSRYFKKWTGMPVSVYIENVTMKVAKHLLVDKKLSVKEVAKELGFSDQFVFSKKFKKYFGFPPSTLKKISI